MTTVDPPTSTTPPARRARARYAWADYADGEFWQWRDEPPGETPTESRRAADRIRLAARDWAARRGGTIDARRADHGRKLWIAIHLPGSARSGG